MAEIIGKLFLVKIYLIQEVENMVMLVKLKSLEIMFGLLQIQRHYIIQLTEEIIGKRTNVLLMTLVEMQFHLVTLIME